MKDWQQFAACRDADPALFFPDAGRTSKAKKFCKVCPVVEECLACCLENEEPTYRHGVWGNTSAYERRIIYDGIDGADVIPEPEEFCTQGHKFVNWNIIMIDGQRHCKKCYFAARSHCKNGHEWIPKNLCVRSDRTACVLCERDRNQARYRKRVA